MACTLAYSRSRVSDDDVRERSIKHMHHSNYPFIALPAPSRAGPSAIGFWGFDFQFFFLVAHIKLQDRLLRHIYSFLNGTAPREERQRRDSECCTSVPFYKCLKALKEIHYDARCSPAFVEEHHKCQYSAVSRTHAVDGKSLRTAKRRSEVEGRHAKLKVMENNFDYGTERSRKRGEGWLRGGWLPADRS